MGKPGPKQIPVTARIQKGTKGGIVQPSISGMGSIAKMKKAPMKKSLVGNQDQLPANLQAGIKAAPGKTYGSPAKIVGRSRGGYKGVTKKPSEAPKSKSGYTDMTFAEYRKSGLMKPEEAKFYKGSGTKRVKTSTKSKSFDSSKSNGYTGAQIAKGAAAKGAEYAVQSKNTPYIGTGLGLGKTMQKEKAAKSSKKVTSNTNAGNAKSVRGGFFGTDDYKKSVSVSDKDNARKDFTANLKNQSKPKAKAVKAIKAKGVKSVAKPKAEIKTKLATTAAKPTAKPTKKQVRKAKSVERKTTRAAKARRKSIEALESGNLAKAKRLKRREARINKRIEKKKSGQASKAIEPK